MNTPLPARYTATLLRLALGTMYLAHGLMKFLIFTPAGTAQFFSSLGLPGWLGEMAMFGEIAGGIALLAGFFSRWVALVLLPSLIGAIILVHAANGWSFTNQGGGWEYPAMLIVVSVAVISLGDGALSIRKFIPASLQPRWA